jgi:arylsulfatase A-like enzyme
MTGRYRQRVGFEFNTGARRLAHEEGRGLDTTATTVADVLRAAGYATVMVGKWHLGSQDRCHPLERGLEEFFGFLIGEHTYFPDTVANREPWETILRGTQRANETEYLTDAFAREAVDFTPAGATSRSSSTWRSMQCIRLSRRRSSISPGSRTSSTRTCVPTTP